MSFFSLYDFFLLNVITRCPMISTLLNHLSQYALHAKILWNTQLYNYSANSRERIAQTKILIIASLFISSFFFDDTLSKRYKRLRNNDSITLKKQPLMCFNLWLENPVSLTKLSSKPHYISIIVTTNLNFSFICYWCTQLWNSANLFDYNCEYELEAQK